MSFRHLAIAAAAAAAFGAAAPAAAGSFASVSLGQFGYTLFDLNPSDGVSASVEFLTGNGIYGSYVQTSATDPSTGSESSTSWSFVPFGAAAVSSSIGLASAQASVSGSATAGSLLYQASGAALGSTMPSSTTQFSANAGVSNYSALSFALSPNTLIVFSGNANLLAQTTIGRDPNPASFLTEFASASVSINVSGPSASGGQGYQNSSDGRSLSASFEYIFNPITGQYGYGGQLLTLEGIALAASFTNVSDSSLTGTLALNASVSGSSPMTPIPEPGSAALLLAGLVGVGAWVRRRR